MDLGQFKTNHKPSAPWYKSCWVLIFWTKPKDSIGVKPGNWLHWFLIPCFRLLLQLAFLNWCYLVDRFARILLKYLLLVSIISVARTLNLLQKCKEIITSNTSNLFEALYIAIFSVYLKHLCLAPRRISTHKHSSLLKNSSPAWHTTHITKQTTNQYYNFGH